MAIIADFVSHLSGLEAVQSFCGDNIFAVVNKDITSGNSIVYSPRDGEREVWYAGAKGKAVLTIQVDIYSQSFTDNQTVFNVILETFNGFSGILNNNTDIFYADVKNRTELIDGLDSNTYRTTFDIYLTY